MEISASGTLAEERIVTAALLVIGDEILSGRKRGSQYRNCRRASDQHRHTAQGGARRAGRGGGDRRRRQLAARPLHLSVHDRRHRPDPPDDITADSLAKAFGVSIGIDPRAEKILVDYFATRGVKATPARLRMARIPSGRLVDRQSVSAAPGFRIGNVFVMAGIRTSCKRCCKE